MLNVIILFKLSKYFLNFSPPKLLLKILDKLFVFERIIRKSGFWGNAGCLEYWNRLIWKGREQIFNLFRNSVVFVSVTCNIDSLDLFI